MEQGDSDLESLQKQLEVIRALCRTKEKEIERLNKEIETYKERLQRMVWFVENEVNKACKAPELSYKPCINKIRKI